MFLSYLVENYYSYYLERCVRAHHHTQDTAHTAHSPSELYAEEESGKRLRLSRKTNYALQISILSDNIILMPVVVLVVVVVVVGALRIIAAHRMWKNKRKKNNTI